MKIISSDLQGIVVNQIWNYVYSPGKLRISKLNNIFKNSFITGPVHYTKKNTKNKNKNRKTDKQKNRKTDKQKNKIIVSCYTRVGTKCLPKI